MCWKGCEEIGIHTLLVGMCLGKTQSPPPVCLSITLTPLPHSEHFLVGFSLPPSNSLWDQLGVIQFNSMLTLSTWKQGQIPQVKVSVPWNCPPLHMPIKSSRTPDYLQFLFNLTTNQRFPLPPPTGIQLFARTTHKTQGNIVFASLLYNKGYDKGHKGYK